MRREGILQEQAMLNIRWPEDKVGTLFMLYTGIPKIVTAAKARGDVTPLKEVWPPLLWKQQIIHKQTHLMPWRSPLRFSNFMYLLLISSTIQKKKSKLLHTNDSFTKLLKLA